MTAADTRSSIEAHAFDLVLFLRGRPCGPEGLGSYDRCDGAKGKRCGVHAAAEQVAADVALLLDESDTLRGLIRKGYRTLDSMLDRVTADELNEFSDVLVELKQAAPSEADLYEEEQASAAPHYVDESELPFDVATTGELEITQDVPQRWQERRS